MGRRISFKRLRNLLCWISNDIKELVSDDDDGGGEEEGYESDDMCNSVGLQMVLRTFSKE